MGVKAVGLGRDHEWKLWEWDGSGIDHCRTGMGMTAAGTGQDREQRTSPMQISSGDTLQLESKGRYGL